MEHFKDKVCFVTGAASGIGKALSRELLTLGARKVVATDVNGEQLDSLVAQLGEQGSRVTMQKLDVTDYDAFSKVMNKTVAQEGRIDFIFNIAGITVIGEARDLSIDHWRKILNVNLNGVLHGNELAYRQMVKQGSGHIVNMSSVQGFVPVPMESPYVTSKFAVLGLSQALRVEGAGLLV